MPRQPTEKATFMGEVRVRMLKNILVSSWLIFRGYVLAVRLGSVSSGGSMTTVVLSPCSPVAYFFLFSFLFSFFSFFFCMLHRVVPVLSSPGLDTLRVQVLPTQCECKKATGMASVGHAWCARRNKELQCGIYFLPLSALINLNDNYLQSVQSGSLLVRTVAATDIALSRC